MLHFLLGVLIAVTLGIIGINAAFMAVSPQRWFRLPTWLRVWMVYSILS